MEEIDLFVLEQILSKIRNMVIRISGIGICTISKSNDVLSE